MQILADISTSSSGSSRWAAFSAPGAWLFALCAVVLPNLVFLILSVFTIIDRTGALALYLLIGILALRIPLWITSVLYLSALAYDLVIVISSIFMLHPRLLLHSLHYMVSFNLFASGTYLLIAFGLILSFGVTIFLLHRFRSQMRDSSYLPAILCLMLIVGANTVSGVPPLLALTRGMAPPPEFGSALGQANIANSAEGVQNNVLLVMVEGMGAFANKDHKAFLAERLNTALLQDKYDISSGTAPYNGSTTSGEMRELCGRWGDYLDFLEGKPIQCLPQKLRAAGIETRAFHAYFGSFFSSEKWYPKVGFEKALFARDLANAYPTDQVPLCGVTFEGLCDMAVADQLQIYLTNGAEQPRFTYWLTLNSHIPIAPDEGTNHFDCERGGPFNDRFICDMTEMWMDVLDRVVQIANDPMLPPTDIVVVGDHHPPLWTRSGRGQFEKGKVAWFALKAKD